MKVDDPFIGLTHAHSPRRIQWLKYIRISTRRIHGRERLDVGDFLSRGLYSSRPIFRPSPCVCGSVHTRFSPFSILLDRMVRVHRRVAQPLLLSFATRSPILSPRSRVIPCSFLHRVESSASATRTSHATIVSQVSIRLHRVTLPQTSAQCADSRFVKRIQCAHVISAELLARELKM